ncbi:hypothetical protein DT603_15475 [Pseudoxanthomonas gei]|uniref:Uncharacterized protein n=1 Tax=Pseudoxanthomonas gei TaxID=1383030 RepID=A0ABX0ALW0_9GAMM|nr:hypothetical protein [Pseudoxanthomonas gei]NDK40238.1 hypothetical protein [Pseudoxanthomonas gei]
MNRNTQNALFFVLLASLLVATRLNLPQSLTHFGPIPDASWAAFFLGGFYLRAASRWAFPVFMALAVLVDYLVIRGQGMDFFAHYCMSAAYWFLVPAYFALWFGGMQLRRHYQGANGKALAVLATSLLASVVVCHLLSQGSFYWLSDSVTEPTFAGWWKNYSDWFVPYLRTSAIYVGLAVIVHVGVTQALRLQGRIRSVR